MSAGFAATLADYLTAADYYAADARAAADRLPLSPDAEQARHVMARRAAESPKTGGGTMTPQTVAMNWRANVGDAAHTLRRMEQAAPAFDPASPEGMMRTAARALLRALGELEEAETSTERAQRIVDAVLADESLGSWEQRMMSVALTTIHELTSQEGA